MKTDRYRLERIAEMGNQLLDVVDDLGITEAALSNDYRLQWLVTTPYSILVSRSTVFPPT